VVAGRFMSSKTKPPFRDRLTAWAAVIAALLGVLITILGLPQHVNNFFKELKGVEQDTDEPALELNQPEVIEPTPPLNRTNVEVSPDVQGGNANNENNIRIELPPPAEAPASEPSYRSAPETQPTLDSVPAEKVTPAEDQDYNKRGSAPDNYGIIDSDVNSRDTNNIYNGTVYNGTVYNAPAIPSSPATPSALPSTPQQSSNANQEPAQNRFEPIPAEDSISEEYGIDTTKGW